MIVLFPKLIHGKLEFQQQSVDLVFSVAATLLPSSEKVLLPEDRNANMAGSDQFLADKSPGSEFSRAQVLDS